MNAEMNTKLDEIIILMEHIQEGLVSCVDALEAVDKLWTENALEFSEEMNSNSPVGLVWAKVREALIKARWPR